MDWIQATQLVGVPVVILIALASGFVRACRWCAPRVDRFIDGHQALLDKTCELQGEIKLLVVAVGERVDAHDVRENQRFETLHGGLEQLSHHFSTPQARKDA